MSHTFAFAARIASSLAAVVFLASPGASQVLLHQATGAAAGDGLGVAASIGDVTGDGKLDLALGAPQAAAGRGQVRVLSGATFAQLFVVQGASVGDQLGAALAGAGDVNGDGVPDILAGAPGAGQGAGAVRVLSGANGAVLLDLPGNQAAAALGHALGGAGDADLDGVPDLLGGAPLWSASPGAAQGQAQMWSGATGTLLEIITGNAGDHLGTSIGGWSMVDGEAGEILGCSQDGSGGTGKVLVLSPADFSVLASVSGTQPAQRFGAAVARIGDANGDGAVDLAVGAPGAGGSVALLSGADLSTLLTLTAPASGTDFGGVVGAVGDVNGDGKADVAVGAPLSDRNGADAGALTILSGTTGAVLYDVVGSQPGDRLGDSMASLGDRDGDGRAEFAIGLPGSDASAANAGQVAIVSPTLWNTVENGLPGVDGIPRLSGDGGLLGGDSATLSLHSARPITAATLVVGLSLVLDTANGLLVPMPDVVVQGLLTNSQGQLEFDFALVQGLPSGAVVYQQFLLADASAPGGIARSNTVAATVP
jgi:hypothetical protein